MNRSSLNISSFELFNSSSNSFLDKVYVIFREGIGWVD